MSYDIRQYSERMFEVEIPLGNGRSIIDNGMSEQEALSRAIARLVEYTHVLQTELAEDMIFIPHPNEARL
jgi:hypothetical protein